MPSFEFVTWPGGGNLAPALGIARELGGRGHGVSFLGGESQRSTILAAGMAFRPYRRSLEAEAEPKPSDDRLGALIDRVWLNTDLTDDLLGVLDGGAIDAVVVDCMLEGVLARSSELKVPTAVLVHGLFKSVLPMRDFLVTFGNQRRAESGERPLDADSLKWESKDLVIVTTLREFDGVDADPAPNVRYVGPVLPFAPPSSAWRSPWDEGDSRPMILASLSTMTGQATPESAQDILDALAASPFRVLLTTGAVPPESVSVPPNCVVVAHAPHTVILPKSDLMITHGGHGSAMGALAEGVPLVCIPGAAADQPIVAARVEAVGAGRTVSSDEVAAKLASVATEVIAQSSYREAAGAMARMIAATAGAKDGAQILERLVEARS
jgi:UDP:flavonoid glycosyltransferase YjiC (YdhE family)